MRKSMMSFMIASFLLTGATVVMAQDNEDGRRFGNFCSSCHGTAGAAVGEAIPSIGGQHKEYLAKAMKEMKPQIVNGKEQAPLRYSTLMQIFLKGYSDKEIDAMAEWYSQQPWVNTKNKLDQKLVAKGKNSKNLETCVSCHAANGNNVEDKEIPRIGGQPSLYLYHAMLEYKEGKRNNAGRASEMDVVKEMSDDDLRALAEYFSSLK